MALWPKKGEPKKAGDLVKPIGEANPPRAIPAKNGPAPAAAAPQPSGQPELTPEQRQKRAAASKLAAAAFGEIVTVFMRSEQHKHYTLKDLEWLVVPAVATGQYSVAEAQHKGHGLVSPIGVVLWASVSPEVDKRLSANIGKAVKLMANEWRSGDVLWIVDAVGESRVVQALIKQLIEKQFSGKSVKVRARGKDGKPQIGVLTAQKTDAV